MMARSLRLGITPKFEESARLPAAGRHVCWNSGRNKTTNRYWHRAL